MTPAQIKNKYKDRIVAILNKIRTILLKHNIKADEPYDESCGDYRWCLLVRAGPGEEDLIDITFRIDESEKCDGEKGGVTFSIDVVEYGGRVLGGLAPCNYTDECWVPRNKPAQVEKRFKCLEDADYSDIHESITKSELYTHA